MTNKDKFLRDGVDYIELARQLSDYIYNKSPVKKCVFPDEIGNFFEQEVKPTLTEDERVILRNLPKDYETIGKCVNGVLYVTTDRKIYFDKAFGGFFNHLFQFIQERRRIFY